MLNNETKKLELSDRLFIVLAILIFGILGHFIISSIFEFKSFFDNNSREITIQGEGRVFARPDVALIKLGITTDGWKAEVAVKENAEKMNAVLKEIKFLNVEEKDIQTSKYNLSLRYEWIEGKRIFRGYALEQEVKVKIRDFEKIGEIIERAASQGANLVGELYFTVDDIDLVRQKAREEAIKKAKIKAREIAKQSGIKLGKLINVYEGSVFMPYSSDIAASPIEFAVSKSVPEIQPGEQEVTVEINLVYRIK
jgi:uncharacterized protein YggE